VLVGGGGCALLRCWWHFNSVFFILFHDSFVLTDGILEERGTSMAG
jgi:hypothetical protein